MLIGGDYRHKSTTTMCAAPPCTPHAAQVGKAGFKHSKSNTNITHAVVGFVSTVISLQWFSACSGKITLSGTDEAIEVDVVVRHRIGNIYFSGLCLRSSSYISMVCFQPLQCRLGYIYLSFRHLSLLSENNGKGFLNGSYYICIYMARRGFLNGSYCICIYMARRGFLNGSYYICIHMARRGFLNGSQALHDASQSQHRSTSLEYLDGLTLPLRVDGLTLPRTLRLPRSGSTAS